MRKLILSSALVFVAAALAGCSSGGGGGGMGGGTGGGKDASGGGSYHGTVVSAGPVTEQGKALPSPSQGESAVPEVGPKIVQTASLTLSVRRGRFEDTIDEARTIATGLGGFVVSSSSSQGGFKRLVRGTLVVRVPSSGYADAMKALSALGRVEGRQEAGQDVSQEYVDLQARTRQLEAVEAQLLQLLERANTVGAALAVQRELSQVQLELEQAKGRLNYLDDQVAFATISLAVHERLLVAKGADGGGFGIVDAWSKAASGFLAVLGWMFVALATAAPVILLLVLGLLLGRTLRRRLAQA
jgi:Domain of unknown function (DUF4349)